MSWLKKLATAIKTKDEDALSQLIESAPEIPSDGMGAIPGSSTININIPSQATSLPAENRTTTDEENGVEKKEEEKTGDDGDIATALQAILARLDKLEGKTTDADPAGGEDAEEDKKVTADAAYKRNIIADAEIICPGFQPAGEKGLKRQVLSQALRTGDSLKAFGVSDFDKAPKATVDAVFTAAVAMNKAKNHLNPLGMKTGDAAPNTRHVTPAQLNQLNRDFWNKRK